MVHMKFKHLQCELDSILLIFKLQSKFAVDLIV